MMNVPHPEVILTHESDLDGLISGTLLQRLAKQLFGNEPPLEAYHSHRWKQRSMSESSAWVCDLAFEPRLDKLNWLIVDHHKTETTPRNAKLIHDTNKSAGLLCYELCQQFGLGSPQLERLVHLSNVADLFLENDPDFKLAMDYANLVKCYQFWNLHTLLEGRVENLLDHPLLEVMATKRRVEDPIGYAWSARNITEITPTVGLVETVIGNSNQILHQLLEQEATPYPVLLTLFRKGSGPFIVSLRSRNGEALKVAEQLQGGGHANACGATLPRSITQHSEATDYLAKVLNPDFTGDGSLNSLESVFDSLKL